MYLDLKTDSNHISDFRTLETPCVNYLSLTSISYMLNLVQSIKDEAAAKTEEATRSKLLPDATDASFVIKSGMLKKADPNGGHWKDRFFKLHNKSRQYALEYFETEASPKAKGIVNLACLSADNFNSVHRQLYGPWGVTLEPRWWDKYGRQWYFICKDEQEEKDWYDALRSACWKAGPPLAGDEVLGAAFKDAVEATADEFGAYGINFTEFDEIQSMTKLIFHVVKRDTLDRCFDGFSAPGKDMIIDAACGAITTSITAAVTVGWTAVQTAAGGVTDNIKSVCGDSLQPLVDAEIKILNTVGEIAEKTVGAALKTITSKLFPGTMALMAVPVGLAFANTITGFDEYVKKNMIPELGKGEDSDNDIEILADRQTWYYWSGPLSKAKEAAREIRDILSDVMAFKQGTGISPWEVCYKVEDAVEELYRAAFQKFMMCYRENKDGDHIALANVIVGEMIHDAPEHINDVFFNIFGETMQGNPLWRDLIAGPMKSAAEPMAETIEAIPVVNFLIDLNDMVDRALETALTSCLAPSVTEAVTGVIKADELIKATGATPAAE